MAERYSKPRIDQNAPRAERAAAEQEAAARHGRPAPAWIPGGDAFRVARSSRTPQAARLGIVHAAQHEVADRDFGEAVRLGDLDRESERVLASLKPYVEGQRIAVEAALKAIGEAPRQEALGQIAAKLAELREAGADPTWIEGVARQIDRLAFPGEYKAADKSLPGGGRTAR